VFPKIERSDSGNRGAARRPRARVGQLAAALIVLVAVAGCSSSSSPSAAPASSSPPASLPSTAAPVPPPSTPASPAVTGPLACATSSLNVTLGPSSGYAGGVDQTIVFTNTSGTTCTLFGYPGVSLVSAPPYKQIGLAAQRASRVPVKLITLATGAAANAVLQIVDALNFGSATCSPTQAAFLRIYPPNQTAPVYLADTSEICAQPVQTLFISAVQAGAGGSA
jgi:hypothetical protein